MSLIIQFNSSITHKDTLSPINDHFTALYEYCTVPIKISALVIDMPINMTFKHIYRAQMILKTQPECKFIVGATETYLPTAIPILGELIHKNKQNLFCEMVF